MTPKKTAIVGLGGFGKAHHLAALELERRGAVRLVATCDPQAPALHEDAAELRFSDRGVKVYEDFDTLLERHGSELDLCIVSSPIQTHADFHQRCVAREIPCYLEKPPTLDPSELETMIRRDAAARWRTQVGFLFVGDDVRQTLKRGIVDGEFGRLRQVAFLGLSPRSTAYYGRSSWAGRLNLRDILLLDSCCGNAMSHYLHNLLFLAGTENHSAWAVPASLESELYRANSIQGADTIFARGTLQNGVEIRVAATHACRESDMREVLNFETATVELTSAFCRIVSDVGGEIVIPARPKSLAENVAAYVEYLEEHLSGPLSPLEDCRPFVHLNALFYLASGGIQSVLPPHQSSHQIPGDGAEIHAIEDIEKVARELTASGRLPSEQRVPWAAPGRSAMAENISSLRAEIFSGRFGDLESL